MLIQRGGANNTFDHDKHKYGNETAIHIYRIAPTQMI